MARDANGFESPLSHGYSRMGSHFYAHADHVIASNHHEGSPSRLQRSTTLLEVRTLLQEHALHTFDYEKLKTSASELKKKKKPIREYYEHLNEQLDYYKEIDDLLLEATPAVAHNFADCNEGSPLLPITREGAQKKAEEHQRKIRLAINVNFVINVLLLLGKIAVVLLSNSLSLLASAVDSAMDFLSTLIIYFTAQTAEKQDAYKYPTGRRRLPVLGVVIFSVVMITAFFQVLVESIKQLFSKDLALVVLPISVAITMAATVAIKLAVWISYRHFRDQSIQALSQDAMNDVVFSIFSIIFPFVDSLFGVAYLDPLGAALLSIYIIKEWAETLYTCVNDLIGCRADPIQHNRVIYLATRFSPLIKAVRHVNVYSGGGGLTVEIDVLLPQDTSLPKAHNICESVQYALESLEDVSRAFVHADYLTANPSGHLQR